MQPGWRGPLFLILLGIIGLFGAGPGRAGEAPVLSLPIACQPHKTCFIQTYVDDDPGPGAKDYTCGTATYDRHSGVDFRLLSAAAATKTPFPVLASADGTVKGVRDGVEDVFFKQAKRQDVAGRECGNGIILDHGNGWETQYCHMRKGSVRVAKGQTVKRGDQLGEAGYSGMADFAQVHLSVRHNGKIIDPFLSDGTGSCDPNARGPGLWEPSAAAAFPYKNGEMIGSGFAGDDPNATALELDDQHVAPLTSTSKAFVLYGWFINLKKGDRINFTALGPPGELFDESSAPLDRDKATFLAFIGKKREGDLWPAGHYDGRVALIRDGGIIATNVVTFEMK
ncbi:MAG: M23 family metallopeptidase [Hyphomicrobium sp.]|uniref:M23 family metallopeptidase n=1 Tax=Hyphomicrobium sp. TaxID=82 RepID=UPI0039E719AD